MLSCLDALFEHQRDGVPFDAAVQALAEMLVVHANEVDFEIDSDDTLSQAGARCANGFGAGWW